MNARLCLFGALFVLAPCDTARAQRRVVTVNLGVIDDDVDDDLFEIAIDSQLPQAATIERDLKLQVRARLALVRRVCAPSDEQMEALYREGERLVAGQMAAVTNALEHGIQPQAQLADAARARESDLERAIHNALDDAQRAKYDGERRAGRERLRQARIANWVAAFDGLLMLSDAQHRALSRLLDERWRKPLEEPPHWIAPSDGSVVLFRRVHGAVVQGTTGLPRLADAEWALLDDFQRAAWEKSQGSERAVGKVIRLREAAELRPRALLNQQLKLRQLLVARPNAVGAEGGGHNVFTGDDENADSDVNVANEEDADEENGAEAEEFKVVVDELVAEMRGDAVWVDLAPEATSNEHTRKFLSYLKRAIDEIAAEADLSDAQRRKLELAGKLDFKRFIDGRNDREAAEEEEMIDVGDEAIGAVIDADSSLFRKLLKQLLTAEQTAKRNDTRDRRRRFTADAARQSAVAALAQRVPLTTAQWTELLTLLEAEFVQRAEEAPMNALTIVPRGRLKPLFDPDQWDLIKKIFDEAPQGNWLW